MRLFDEPPASVRLSRACASLKLNRSSVFWRQKRGRITADQKASYLSRQHTKQPRALGSAERA